MTQLFAALLLGPPLLIKALWRQLRYEREHTRRPPSNPHETERAIAKALNERED